MFFGLLALCALTLPVLAQECKPFKSPDGLIEYTTGNGVGSCSERSVAQIASPFIGLKCTSNAGKMDCVAGKPKESIVATMDVDICVSVDGSKLKQFQLSANIWSVKERCSTTFPPTLPHFHVQLGKSNTVCINPGNGCIRLSALDPEAQERILTLAFDGAFQLIIEMIMRTEKDPV
jgi:hypothetical protein